MINNFDVLWQMAYSVGCENCNSKTTAKIAVLLYIFINVGLLAVVFAIKIFAILF